jgi:rSAM/selenodomain-associated transferase 2
MTGVLDLETGSNCPIREASPTAFLPPPLRLGIIVPVYNEARILEQSLAHLQELAHENQVLVVDGGSQDGSASIARRFFPTAICQRRGRGPQMDLGAARLSTDVVLFLHVDSWLPPDFAQQIRLVLADPQVAGGCFRLQFDDLHPLLRFYAWCTRFPSRFCHFGDQAFFVRREVFHRIGGYRGLPFLEDVDLLRRLRRTGRFVVLTGPVMTSGRRFRRRGVLRQELRNILLVALAEAGIPAEWLQQFYPDVR